MGEVVIASSPATLEATTAVRARRIIRLRRSRERLLGTGLFAEPVWDMLLELAATHWEGRRSTVTSICAAAAVPSSTALRWLGQLDSRGMVIRSHDPLNQRRVYVEPSAETLGAMLTLLSEARAQHERRGRGRERT